MTVGIFDGAAGRAERAAREADREASRTPVTSPANSARSRSAPARHPAAAFEWVKYLTSAESERRYGVTSGLWPARTGAITGTRLQSDPVYAAFREMITVGRMYPSIPAWIVVESIIAKDLADLWHASGALTRDEVRAILIKTTKDIDATLKDPTQIGIN